MAIFHYTVKIVGRSKGKSIISASAYLNGDVMKNEETGRISYYTSKREVVYTSLMMCENAPQEWQNVPAENIKRFQKSVRYKRADNKEVVLEKFKLTFQKQCLWNEVLKIEKSSDAQLGRSFEFSLPKEWNRQEQIEYTTDYIQKNFVDKGMCADWSIHDKGDGNPHVHLLVTMRPFNPDHSWGNKEVKDWEFVRDTDGNIVVDESHPDWWQDKTMPLERIELTACKNTDSMAYAFYTHDIQMLVCDLTGTNTSNVYGSGSYTDIPTSVMQYIGFNVTRAPFNDPKLRAALSLGMDRAGGLPVNQLIDYCYSGRSKDQVKKTLGRRAGMFSYLGTTDFRVICAKVTEGDPQFVEAYQALVYQLAKDIGAMAAVLHFEVDAIVYTGGMAYEQFFCDDITAYVGRLAPVLRFPGEEEMRALAEGALRVLHGQAQPLAY